MNKDGPAALLTIVLSTMLGCPSNPAMNDEAAHSGAAVSQGRDVSFTSDPGASEGQFADSQDLVTDLRGAVSFVAYEQLYDVRVPGFDIHLVTIAGPIDLATVGIGSPDGKPDQLAFVAQDGTCPTE
jgi:hypothetical protein